jgi:hypothetical protein
MSAACWCATTAASPVNMTFVDNRTSWAGTPALLRYALNPEARQFVWEKTRRELLPLRHQSLLAGRGRARHVADGPGHPALSPRQWAGGGQPIPDDVRQKAFMMACVPQARRKSSTCAVAPGQAASVTVLAIVVGRHRLQPSKSCASRYPYRAKYWPERHTLVDDRHRRLLRR